MKKKLLVMASLMVCNSCIASDNAHNTPTHGAADRTLEQLQDIMRTQQELIAAARRYQNDPVRVMQERQAILEQHVRRLGGLPHTNTSNPPCQNAPEQQ